MKKIFTLSCLFLTAWLAQAQLPNGSIAPNFTAKDIEGNTWNLYDLLDQGKTVVIDVSATWCAPCWAYHNTGALEDLYAKYGPKGTNEMMVFLVEGDATTTLDDLNGTGNNTQGDWVSSTPYPIFDNADIANLYAITYFPTIYFICQNRILQEAGQVTTDEIYALRNSCAQAQGANNAAVLNYSDFQGTFCAGKVVNPSIKMQNLGTDPMTTAEVELYQDGVLKQTLNWTGNLSTYQIDDVKFNSLVLTATTTLSVKVKSVNGVADEDATNNEVAITNTLSPTYSAANLVTLQLRTDAYPGETYWELLDGEGNVLYKGGNERVGHSGASSAGAYTGANAVYTGQYALPADGCFEFRIYDAYGDGICCTQGNGYYKLLDNSGAVIMQGGSFGAVESKPFQLVNSATVHANGALIGYDGVSGDFCGTLDYTGSVKLQNLGADPITSAEVEIYGDGALLKTVSWTGNIATGHSDDVQLSGLNFDQTTLLDIQVKSINGVADVNDYQNKWTVQLNRNVTKNKDLILEIHTDNWGYEEYWEVQASNGTVIASGGNPKVGPNGGGKRVAKATDPGVYASNDVITEAIELPDGVNDCYSLLLVDDYGDGMPAGSYVLYNSDNTLEVLTVTAAPTTINQIDAKLNSSGTQEFAGVNNLTLAPNPASEGITVRFQLAASMALDIQVYNAVGQAVRSVAQRDFAAGAYQLPVSVADLNSGVYYLQMTDGKQQLTRKFVVMTH